MTTQAGTGQDRVLLGVSVMVGTALLMSLGDALVKLFSNDFTIWQIYVLRSLLALPVIVAIVRFTPGRGAVALRPCRLGWTIARSLCLMLMWLCFYIALPVLTLPTVAAAYYTAPLFITVLSALLGGETVGGRRWLAVAIGFAGVVVILRPGEDAFSLLALLPVVSALFYAFAALLTRARLADENPFVLSLALNLMFLGVGLVATSINLVWQPDVGASASHRFMLARWTPMAADEWASMALLAVLIVAVSAGVVKAYQCAPSSVIAVFDYSYLVFATLWSLVLLAQAPDETTIAGMVLIAVGGWLALSGPRRPPTP